MKVITGSAKGCRLDMPRNNDTRPTAARVKESVFSIIQFELEGRRVLDMFAGSGQMGIETLSRGAAAAVFVDENPAAIETIRQNLIKTKLETNAEVVRTDYKSFLKFTKDKFDIAFLDPPYDKNILHSALTLVSGIMNEWATIVCEHSPKEILSETFGEFTKIKTHKYGQVAVSVYNNHTEDET